jgi:hypothetical protein
VTNNDAILLQNKAGVLKNKSGVFKITPDLFVLYALFERLELEALLLEPADRGG